MMASAGGVTLYYHPMSFYSQKAAFGLKEKGIEFSVKIVSPSVTYDAYEPWFMRINPKGQVPVLQHGDVYISDSTKIVEYLDGHFEGGKLVPYPSSEEGTVYKRLLALLDTIIIEAVTFGVIAHPRFSDGFDLPDEALNKMREGMTKNTRTEALKRHQAENPDLFEAYQKKLEFFSKFGMKLKDETFVDSQIQALKRVLDEVEKHLVDSKANQSQSWLCGQSFSFADISLAVLMRRVYFLGIQRLVVDDAQHPHLMQYYQRLRERKSFQDVCLRALAH